MYSSNAIKIYLDFNSSRKIVKGAIELFIFAAFIFLGLLCNSRRRRFSTNQRNGLTVKKVC